jgi:hypothetical protein
MKSKLSGLSNMKQFDYTCLSIEMIQNVKQNAELRFSKGRVFHTKGRIFSFSSNFEHQFDANLMTFTPEFNTRRDHMKYSKFNIEHPPEFAGQWSPFSSEDG